MSVGRNSLTSTRGGKIRDEILKRTSGLEVIWARSAEETLAGLPEADIMLSKGMKADHLARAAKLHWVHMSSAGPDHFFKRSEVTAEDFLRRGIMITTSKGAGTESIAEQVLCYMLMFMRCMPLAQRQQMKRQWRRYAGGELRGSTLGIIGLGRIGSRVAQFAKCHDMTVLATKGDPTRHGGVADEVLPTAAYREVMKRADFVLLSCPITDQTRLIINPETLRLMKPTAYLLNVARGECIDETALVEALRSGIIAGYAADNHGQQKYPVTDETLERLADDSPLWDMENVIITPNCATAGPRRYEYMGQIIAENYNLVEAGQEPATRLVWQGRVF